MKAIKIILPIVVVALIGFFVWKWVVTPSEVGAIRPPDNQFTERIKKEIDSLSHLSASKFSKEFYKGIQYRITDYHKQKFFNKSENDNNQWQEILSKDIYSAYAPKFAEQALYVFNHSDWKITYLQFIRAEVRTLQSSAYLEQGSPVATQFKNIQGILAKYDEIADFISACNGFSYSCNDIADCFPDVSDKVQRSRTYLVNNLENSYVNNCTRLKNGLRQVPKMLFNKHINYLCNKIAQNSGRYREYNYHSDYNNAVYTPLRNQIDALENDTYGVSDSAFDSAYSSLENLLSVDNRNAVDYFRSLNNR